MTFFSQNRTNDKDGKNTPRLISPNNGTTCLL